MISSFIAKPDCRVLPLGVCSVIGINMSPRIGTLTAVLLILSLIVIVTDRLVTHSGAGNGAKSIG